MSSELLDKYFEQHEEGWIGYKIFGGFYIPPPHWPADPQPGDVLTDIGRMRLDPKVECGAGINVATKRYMQKLVDSNYDCTYETPDWAYDKEGMLKKKYIKHVQGNWNEETGKYYEKPVYRVILLKDQRTVVPNYFTGKVRTKSIKILDKIVSKGRYFRGWCEENNIPTLGDYDVWI